MRKHRESFVKIVLAEKKARTGVQALWFDFCDRVQFREQLPRKWFLVNNRRYIGGRVGLGRHGPGK
jgi:hypothetical protein